jgi:hypothetical protein
MKAKNGKAAKTMTAGKQRERQPHPFGPPEARAKGFTFPSPNPTLFVHAGKSVTNLPQNLQDIFAAVEKHKDGIPLKELKVPKLGAKTLHWLVRQLAKHEFLRVKPEKEAEKAAKAKPKAKASGAGQPKEGA